MKIGAKIKELRKKRGITQEQLSENLGISFQAVSKWENGIALPDITLVPALAGFFGVTTDELFEYTVPPPLEVQIIKPDKYEDVNKITELLRNNKTVIVNSEDINEEVAKQMKDKIISDIVDVEINQVANKTFIYTLPLAKLSFEKLNSKKTFC